VVLTEQSIRTINANGISFACLERGTGPLVLCVHGFPDTAFGFEQTLTHLAGAGYHAVAPFMRGYHPTGLAPDGNYSVLRLADDILALTTSLGHDRVSIMGHDWGAFAAYTAANLHPDRIDRLVLMCVPHMHATHLTVSQLRKSWYVFFFQLPWLPERIVRREDFAFVDRLYRSWSPNWDPAEFHLAPVKRALAAPGGLKAALAYYRSMIRGASKEQRRIMAQQTAVPTLFLVGESDGSVSTDQFVDVEKAFTSYIEVVRFPGVGHFPHRENFPLFWQKLQPFLERKFV